MSFPSPEELNRIAHKVFNGSASAKEKLIFEEWYNESSPENMEWHSASSEEELRQRIFSKIRGGIIPGMRVRHMRKKGNVARWAVAAAITIAISGVYIYKTYLVKNTETPGIVAVRKQNEVNYTRYVSLPDGSTVLLHANSTLEFPETFAANKREVTLKGEAFFDIQSNPAAPFLIKTGRIITTVLGTAFNIKAYPVNDTITVAVKRGKVKVEEGNKLLAVLLPDESVTYNAITNSVVKKKLEVPGNADEWVKKEMIFDGKTFRAIASELARRYNVEISFRNPALEKCTLKAFFIGTEPIEKVMMILCTVSNATYTWESETRLILDGEGCP